jgi:hypothetical protein
MRIDVRTAGKIIFLESFNKDLFRLVVTFEIEEFSWFVIAQQAEMMSVSIRGVLYSVDFVPPLSRMVVCVLSPSRGSSFYIHFSTKQRLCHSWDGLGDWGPPSTLHFPETDTVLLRDLHTPRLFFFYSG